MHNNWNFYLFRPPTKTESQNRGKIFYDFLPMHYWKYAQMTFTTFFNYRFCSATNEKNLEWTAGILIKKDNFGEQVKVNHSQGVKVLSVQLLCEYSYELKDLCMCVTNFQRPCRQIAISQLFCCVMEWKGFEIRMQLITAMAWKGRQKIFQSSQTINSENFRMMVFSVFFFFS